MYRGAESPLAPSFNEMGALKGSGAQTLPGLRLTTAPIDTACPDPDST